MPKFIVALMSPDENELYPGVIFLNPNLDKIFSKGKNSPKGTRLILLYNDKISNLWFKSIKLLKYFWLSISLGLVKLFIPKIIRWFSENLSLNKSWYFFISCKYDW